jgi:hypothetical protein
MQEIPKQAITSCGRCGTSNPPENRFCGACGVSLGVSPPPEPWSAVDDHVRMLLEQRLKDQKLLEIETAQAIVDRLTGWAKLFGFWAALLLGILAATLAIWGIGSFVDFKRTINSSRDDVLRSINKTTDGLKQLETSAGDVREQFEKVRRELGTLPNDVDRVRAQINALQSQLGSNSQQLTTLQSKVSRIEERIGFVPTKALTPELERTLQAALLSFREYCHGVGFAIRPGAPKVRVEDVPTAGGKPYKNAVSFYLPETGEMVVATQYASEPTYVLHEYMHRLLLPPELTTASDGYYGFESALACYYPASFRHDPKCGFFSLTQGAPFTTPYEKTVWGIKTWGNTFWELRGIIGKEACDRLLVKVWSTLDPNHTNTDYAHYAGSQILAVYSAGGGRDGERIRALFSKHGLEI